MEYIDLEGTADKNGMTFEGDIFEVEGYYKNGKVKFKVEEYEEKKWNEFNLFEKIEDKMEEIKFLRGLTEILTGSTMILLSLYLCLVIFDVYPVHYIYFLYLLSYLISILHTKLTEIGKYHSAEHMAINAYENSFKLTIKNLSKQSRYHSLCSTNFATVRNFIMIIGMIFNFDFLLMYFLAYSLSHEIIDFLDDHKKRFAIIHKILAFFQIPLYTSKPKDKHLYLATKTLNKLIKLESK